MFLVPQTLLQTLSQKKRIRIYVWKVFLSSSHHAIDHVLVETQSLVERDTDSGRDTGSGVNHAIFK